MKTKKSKKAALLALAATFAFATETIPKSIRYSLAEAFIC